MRMIFTTQKYNIIPHRYRRHGLQFLRYMLVGGVMLFVNLMLVWMCITFFGWHYLVATSVAFFAESLVAFFANRRWTFQTNTPFHPGYVKFITLGFYSFIVMLFCTYGFVHFLAFHYVWARTIATVIGGMIGYVLDLRVTFRI
jgi:putative flippase GtrA